MGRNRKRRRNLETSGEVDQSPSSKESEKAVSLPKMRPCLQQKGESISTRTHTARNSKTGSRQLFQMSFRRLSLLVLHKAAVAKHLRSEHQLEDGEDQKVVANVDKMVANVAKMVPNVDFAKFEDKTGVNMSSVYGEL